MSSIPTPPSTTLSTPSPTERPEPIMTSALSTKPIHLIVATSLSPPLGIGLRNSLPWPPIKSDMSFFQRVTRDSRPRNSSSGSINAVVMGRKTYDSIPTKFRPLASRLNVVISRSPLQSLAEAIIEDIKKAKDVKMELSSAESRDGSILLHSPTLSSVAHIMLANSVEAALSALNQPLANTEPVGNIFIIGGTQIYRSILDLNIPLRILQTQIKKTDKGAFECDTFFPMKLEANDKVKAVSDEDAKSWLRKEDDQQISLPQGASNWAKDEKVGVELKVVCWERT